MFEYCITNTGVPLTCRMEDSRYIRECRIHCGEDNLLPILGLLGLKIPNHGLAEVEVKEPSMRPRVIRLVDPVLTKAVSAEHLIDIQVLCPQRLAQQNG